MATTPTNRRGRETTTSAGLAGHIRLFVFGFFAGILFHKNYSATKFSLQMLEESTSLLELQLASSKIRRNSKDSSVAVVVTIGEEQHVTDPSSLGTGNLRNTTQTQESVDDISSHNDDDKVSNKNDEIQPFTKQSGVVFVTKIHGRGQMDQLQQSLCLLNAAYNRRMKYNVLVFVTEPLTDEDIRDLRSIVYPAHLEVESDEEKTLAQHLSTLNTKQMEQLLQHCGVKSKSELSWDTNCCDNHQQKSRNLQGEQQSSSSSSSSCMSLRLNWQSEFRSRHIWYHEALAPYQWMVWFDSDVMMTQVWKQDPVVFAIQNKVHILFAQFSPAQQQGSSSSSAIVKKNMADAQQQLAEKVSAVYGGNKRLCHIGLVNGHLQPEFDKDDGDDCQMMSDDGVMDQMIHGFFHITNLDFYRSEQNYEWYNAMIGSAWANEQVAVTIPALMQEPEKKALELKTHGMQLHLWHKGMIIDNNEQHHHEGSSFQQWFENRGAIDFPQAVDSCRSFIMDPPALQLQ